LRSAYHFRGLTVLLGHSYEKKCTFDGYRLIPDRYYTLPAPGRNAVTLKNESRSIETEIIMSEKQLISVKEIPTIMQGKLSIVWNDRIFDKQIKTG
jgi:hypothetical protein